MTSPQEDYYRGEAAEVFEEARQYQPSGFVGDRVLIRLLGALCLIAAELRGIREAIGDIGADRELP